MERLHSTYWWWKSVNLPREGVRGDARRSNWRNKDVILFSICWLREK
jgi:hypothetical protein